MFQSPRPLLRYRGKLLTTGLIALALVATTIASRRPTPTILAPTIVRGPYLQLGRPTAIIIRWRTDIASDTYAWYGLAPGALTTTVSDPTLTTEHSIELTGLNPDTVYYYAVGYSGGILQGDTNQYKFRTSPLPGTRRPVRVWVIGDSGTADAYAAAVRDAYKAFAAGSETHLWLMLGDNAYTDGTDAEYQAAVFDMYPDFLRSVVLWPTFGNHDGHSASSSSQTGPYYDIFTLPTAAEAGGTPSGTEAYYAFDYANIHFICLNSYDIPRTPTGAMMTWLQQDIANTTQDWVIAYWHHPPYSKGSHDSDVEPPLVEMRQNFVKELESWGVDLVLGGHSHSYERSYLLDGHYGTSDTLDPATMILDNGDGRLGGTGPYQKATPGPTPHAGAVYVVAGSSGQIGGGTPQSPRPLHFPQCQRVPGPRH